MSQRAQRPSFPEGFDPARYNVGRRFDTAEEAHRYANQIVRTAWWRRRFPAAPRRVLVRDGRGAPLARHYAGAYTDARGRRVSVPVIELPTASRNATSLLHELAHVGAGLAHEHDQDYAAAEWALHQRYAPGVLVKRNPATEDTEAVMANRQPTNWRGFSRDVLRSLPAGTNYAEHQRALRAAGKLWTQERAQAPARNPSPAARVPAWGWLALAAGAAWYLNRRAT